MQVSAPGKIYFLAFLKDQFWDPLFSIYIRKFYGIGFWLASWNFIFFHSVLFQYQCETIFSWCQFFNSRQPSPLHSLGWNWTAQIWGFQLLCLPSGPEEWRASLRPIMCCDLQPNLNRISYNKWIKKCPFCKALHPLFENEETRAILTT